MPDIFIAGKKDDNTNQKIDTINKNPDSVLPQKEIPIESSILSPVASWFENLANKTNTVEKAKAFFVNCYHKFDSQQARRDFVGDLGTMDIADRMLRVALRRDTTSKQYQTTLSDVASTMFFKQIRALHANLRAIFFEQKELPAIYEPEINSTDYTYEAGKVIADYHNMLEMYTFDEDKRVEKIDHLLWYLCKYGQAMVSIEWGFETRKIRDRIHRILPDGSEYIGIEEIEKIVKNHPEFLVHDLKDCWFDSSISELEHQRCLIIKKLVPYEELESAQRAGFIQNIEAINQAQLWDGVDTVMANRNTNAGTSVSTEPNGLFPLWHVFMRVPITDDGKWDNTRTTPQLFWASFVGNITGQLVCVRLIKCPYNDGRLPFKMIYLIPDDKGAYHVSLADILAPLYWEQTKIINQCFDNMDLNLRSFWVADGAIMTRDLSFAPNKLVRVERGTNIQKLSVPDMTHIIMPMVSLIEKDANETVGTDKPILGQALGSRATATESAQVLDQAILPIATMAQYISNQLFVWMLEKDAMLWRQFGDMETIKWMVGQDIVEIQPAKLYGDLRIKVNAMGRYINNAVYRMQINSFMANIFPLFAKYIPDSGIRKLGRHLFKLMGIEDTYQYIPDKADFDAYARAIDAARRIIINGEAVEVQPDEDHETHIAVLTPILVNYQNLPRDEQDTNKLNMLRALIAQHKAMLNNAELLARNAGTPTATNPQMLGENMGDILGAIQQGG